jgi:flavorubredoxin
MTKRRFKDGIDWVGAIDWDRRLFDSLIPTPDGTSYNAWLVRGTDKVALLDTVDETKSHELMAQIADEPRIDYVVSHHAEQDHSGTIPRILARYPEAEVLCTPRAVGMLGDLLEIPADRCRGVADNETLDLGGRTLRFMHMPWVHWPETMVSYLEEDRILFSCDLFGSHLATADLIVSHDRILEPAKRYYAEIMMPFRAPIQKHLDRLAELDIDAIAPSHGPAHSDSLFIQSAYREWIGAKPADRVIVPFVSMHGSTARMVEALLAGLSARGISAEPFNLTVTDLGKLAIALVDAATIVLASPVFLNGPHPLVVSAAYLADALRPKALHAAFLGSGSWGGKIADSLQPFLSHLKVEVLGSVQAKGLPKQEDMAAIEALAETILTRHRALGL